MPIGRFSERQLDACMILIYMLTSYTTQNIKVHEEKLMKMTAAIQAAGHIGGMQSEDGSLYIKPSTQQEAGFYTALSTDPYFAAIACRFFGVLTEQRTATGDEIDLSGLVNADMNFLTTADDLIPRGIRSTDNIAIVLENLYSGFKRPSVLDVKLGTVLWDESASAEKRERLDLVSATTTSGIHGLRIAGMSIWDPSSASRQAYDKQFGRSVKPDALVDAFAQFFKYIDAAETKHELAAKIYEEVDFIHHIIADYEVRMKSASVLIVFEGDPKTYDTKRTLLQQQEQLEEEHECCSDSEEEQSKESQFVKVKIIDFAHSKFTPGLGPDENILKGLVKLRRVFRILKDEQEV